MNVDQQSHDRIANLIHSESSPVGIDAKKTHIIIIAMLEQIQTRLDKLEQKIGNSQTK